ncbi:peptidoglycan DD-metalloendopeptidase family protein [Candidatus Gracilibacteria bacterium]|nr:peptidoglycan DD-metalloendopeptidase family protein [Candidatus Gracilibacteria bacterium]
MKTILLVVISILIFLSNLLWVPTLADTQYTDFELNPDLAINLVRQRYLKQSKSANNPIFFGFYDEPWRFPISAPNSFFVDQGYDGPFSHQNKKALDLSSNSGTVVATRSGRVGVVNFGGKWNQWCNSYNDCFNKGGIWNGNHIIINHPDGSSSYYIHLKENSLIGGVVVGRDVTIGAPLAQIGGTGFTCNQNCSGPYSHLHFQVNQGSSNTISTPFDDCNFAGNNCVNGLAVAGRSYTSVNYSSDISTSPGPIYIFGQRRSLNQDLQISDNPTNWLISSIGELKIANSCLTASNNNVSLTSCNNSNEQKWRITSTSGLQSQFNNLCLNLTSFAVGTKPTLANCDNSFLQQFRHSSRPYSLTIFP